MSKYEQLIDCIINEDEAKARELFHQIVVEKSREIYESLIDEQDLEEIGGNEVEELVDEVSADETGMEEGEDMGDDDMGDDMDADDMDADDMGDDMEAGEEGLEDRVMDLESALDELKAEFDALMADEAGEEEHNDGINDPQMDELAFESEEDKDDEEVDESAEEELARLREYVEKISAPSNTDTAQNKKSVVAGKNNMGGTAKNIAQGGDENGRPAPKAQTIASGNRNVPGGKADSLEAAPKAKTGE